MQMSRRPSTRPQKGTFHENLWKDASRILPAGSYRSPANQGLPALPYFALYELRHTFATRLSAGGVADHMVTQMLRQGDADVFKLYSQANSA